jgi:preprotein translocase subunit YajC
MTPLFTNDVLIMLDAPASSPAGGGLSQTLFMVVMIVGIFYFLLFRPQQKQAKEHQTLLAGLKKDDRVVTGAGIHGKIWAVKDDTVILELSRDVRVEMDKSSIRRKVTDGDAAPIKQK